MRSSRLNHLERQLSTLGFNKALEALDLVVEEMSAEAGFARHDGSHYYYHLVDVTQMILNHGIKHDEDLIVASLLHDYLEDVPGVTKKLIEKQFGPIVADVVERLSKKDGINYKENKEAMQEYLDIIEECWRSSIIKTADRVHNFSSLKNSSLSHRKKQLLNTMEFFIPFFKRCRNRYIRFESFFFFAKTSIEPLAAEFERYLKDFEIYENKIKELEKELDKYKYLEESKKKSYNEIGEELKNRPPNVRSIDKKDLYETEKFGWRIIDAKTKELQSNLDGGLYDKSKLNDFMFCVNGDGIVYSLYTNEKNDLVITEISKDYVIVDSKGNTVFNKGKKIELRNELGQLVDINNLEFLVDLVTCDCVEMVLVDSYGDIYFNQLEDWTAHFVDVN